ncbi:MAG TPA: polysaccharide pyruvyl transferase family protein [Candidatus Saccharimonadales bacterium]|nr:polysaccharide pyruvyl transferase family protein [Candidatus Saccharimonadales bacterium]
MKLLTFFKHHDVDDSLLIGFYGGGNYGDELLMETLANLLRGQSCKNISIAYQTIQTYQTYHQDFGYSLVPMRDPRALLRAIRRHKHIIVGGGGLWGLDANFNILLLSLLLLFARFCLRKQVYLLGVGYYGSAPFIGRVSAWLAGRAANQILARDDESYQNFKAVQKHTTQDTDIAWYIDTLDLQPYQSELRQLEQRIRVESKTLFITLRRFRSQARFHLAAVVGQCLKQNENKPIIIALLEPRHVDPEGYELLESWQRHYPNLQILDFSFNPLALYLFFQKYHDKLVFIGPQFHAILSVHLSGVPYLPLAYDNKVKGLLKVIAPGRTLHTLESLRVFDVQRFIDSSYKTPA